MQSTPVLLSDSIMPLYKIALTFALMLGMASVIVGVGYVLFNYFQTDLAFTTAMFDGFVLFLKGAALTAVISFISFFAFWKKHEIQYNNCKASKGTNCNDLGLFRFA